MRTLYTLLFLVAASSAAFSQTDTAFTQEAICSPNGRIDLDKLRNVALKQMVITNLFKKDLSLSAQGLEDEIGVSSVGTFVRRYINTKNDYFDIHNKKDPGAEIAFVALFQRPQDYEMKCIAYPRQLPAVAVARKAVDDFAKGVGNNLILGKNVDELGKPLKARAPAKISVTRDEEVGNTAFQTEFAVASRFETSVTFQNAWTNDEKFTGFLALQPYLASVSTHNSKAKFKDIDKSTLGVAADAVAIPFPGGVNHFSLRADFSTDTSRTYEILKVEAVWLPRFGVFGDSGLALGQYRPLDALGARLYLDLEGRIRYGDIRANATIATLPASGEFTRLGFRSAIRLGFDGEDIWSRLELSATYLYFDTISGAGPVDRINRFDATVAYNFTDNYGVSLTYKKGRDEDLLMPMDLLILAFTLKFGEPQGPIF